MSEYIERDAANEALREFVRAYPNSFCGGIEVARAAIRNLPASDVVPWEWLERYASGMRMNYASDWVQSARKEYKGG